MNTMTARALMVGVLIAICAWLASVARLNVSMWAGVVALGCFYASGGGVAGLQKTIVATLSGVVWVLIAEAVRVAIAGHGVVWAVILGAMACALALQARVPLLSFTAGAFAGAGGALGLGVNPGYGAVRGGGAPAETRRSHAARAAPIPGCRAPAERPSGTSHPPAASRTA